MKLNENQLKEIDEKGYLIIPDCFSKEEVNNLCKAMTTVFNEKLQHLQLSVSIMEKKLKQV